MTILETASAGGGKDPFHILVHEKHLQQHFESGWITAHTFRDYLGFVRGLVDDRTKRLYLFPDLYSVHIQQVTKDHARDLNIELHFIPAGSSDQCWPLDQRIIGCWTEGYE
jgi:hypothetical protein